MHLQSVREMLPYIAAAGHKLYGRSAYVYLQTMTMLPETHPNIHQKFEEGYHVVRRSDILGRTVHRPHHRPGAIEECKGHDINSAPTAGHVHAGMCQHE